LAIYTKTSDYPPFTKGGQGDYSPFTKGGRGDLPGITYNERQFYLQQHNSVAMYAKTLDRWHHNVSAEGNIIYYEISGTSPQNMRFQAFIVPKNQPNEKLPAQLPQTPPSLADSHIIPKARVQEFVDFPATIPLWLNPGYLLQEIRYIENHSVLQLVYTNGIDSVSFFEVAIGGKARYNHTNGISMRDFREYLAYTQSSASVLAWQRDGIAFALVGNKPLHRLMRLVEEMQKQTPKVRNGSVLVS
jgi:hypothetical protein